MELKLKRIEGEAPVRPKTNVMMDVYQRGREDPGGLHDYHYCDCPSVAAVIGCTALCFIIITVILPAACNVSQFLDCTAT